LRTTATVSRGERSASFDAQKPQLGQAAQALDVSDVAAVLQDQLTESCSDRLDRVDSVQVACGEVQLGQRRERSDPFERFEFPSDLQLNPLQRRLDGERFQVDPVVVEQHDFLQILGRVERATHLIPVTRDLPKMRKRGKVNRGAGNCLERQFFQSVAESAQRSEVVDGPVENEQALDRPGIDERKVRLAVTTRIVQPDTIYVLTLNRRLSLRRPAPGDHERAPTRLILDHEVLISSSKHGN
jgi:multidrug efflux pump subunit AcrA (membrane-fusion protein)